MGNFNDPIGEAFDHVCRQILANSRNELYLNMRYLDLALSALRPAVTTDIAGIGTDGACLAANPKVLADLYSQSRLKVNRVYLHLVLHCMFRHLFKNFGDDTLLWHLSCDIAVESVIDSMTNRSVRTGVSRFRKNWYSTLREHLKVLTAEGIYRMLEKRGLSENEYNALKADFGIDDHSLWPDLGDDPDNIPPAAAILRDKWQDIDEKAQTDMETFSSGMADGGGDLSDLLRTELRRRYDYRGFLRKFMVMGEELRADPDSFDYVFYSYGLSLYGNMPLIEPQEMREVKRIRDFVVVLDVSMSTSGELVRRFLEETCSILTSKETYLDRVNIRIIQCDDQIREDMAFTDMELLREYVKNFTLKGGGGTDFRPAFEHVLRLKEEGAFTDLRGMIYFTDGKGIYPRSKPPWESAFIFLEQDYEDREVPPWAIRLILEEDQLKEEKGRIRTDAKFLD